MTSFPQYLTALRPVEEDNEDAFNAIARRCLSLLGHYRISNLAKTSNW